MPTPSARLLALLSLLQARRDWPGALLAERLGISPRTVRRDVDRLRELGYAVAAIKGPDGGYRLQAGSELPPLLFDDDQAVALGVALGLATGAGAGIEEAAMRALTTVRQAMPDRLRRRIDAIEVTALQAPVPPDGASPRDEVDPAALAAVGAAIHAAELLRFAYRPPVERAAAVDHPDADPLPEPVRRAEPHHLVTWGRRWYVVAWDLDREDWRTFRLDRMALRSPTGIRFARREIPGGDLAAFVVGRFRGATDGTAGWPCRGEVVLARPAEEVRPYARDGIVEALDDGRCRLLLGAWSWPALAAAIGAFDADIESVGPPALADAFGLLAGRFAKAARD